MTSESIQTKPDRRQPRRLSLVTAVAATVLSLVACGGQTALPRQAAGPPPTDPAVSGLPATPPAPVSGTILAYDQSGDGTSLTVAKVDIEGMPGWILVHTDDHGPGDVIGHVAIPEGASTNVVVPLDNPVATGPYWVMVHRDGGLVGTLQWPGGIDGPVRPPTGSLAYASNKVTLTVPSPA